MLNQKIMSLRKHIQPSLALWFHVWLQLDRHALFHRLCCPKRHNLRSEGGISPSGTASPWPPIGKGFKAILCVKPGAYCWECRGEEQVLELDFQFHGSQNTQGFFSWNCECFESSSVPFPCPRGPAASEQYLSLILCCRPPRLLTVNPLCCTFQQLWRKKQHPGVHAENIVFWGSQLSQIKAKN